MKKFSIFSCSKDVGANAHEGSAVLYGDVPVIAHAHADLFESRIVGKVLVAKGKEGVVNLLKLACHLFHVVGESRHCHHSCDGDVGQVFKRALVGGF